MTLSHLHGHFYCKSFKGDFYPRDAMQLSSRVRLSVRLSQVGVAPNRLKVVSRKQRGTVAQGIWFHDAKDLDEVPMASPPTGAPNAGGVSEN